METFTITNIYLGCILLICHSVTRINFQLHYLSNFFIDFRYYEDPSDQFRNKGEGTLMLMWNMVLKKEKIFTVTDMCWNPIYFDMFAITVSIRKFIKYIFKTHYKYIITFIFHIIKCILLKVFL
jgi:hypothetical protein